MQISVEEVSRLLAVAPQSRSTQQHVRGGSASRGRDTGQAEFSPTAQEIRLIKREINRLPEVREDRVATLKAQIENGTYHVSGEDIADLIIRRTLADNSGR